MKTAGKRAEITLGLQECYGEGELFQKEDVISFLKKLISQKKTFPWRVIGADLVYPVDGEATSEKALILSTDKNARYGAEYSVDEWKKVVEATAEALRESFNQVRVYVSYLEVEVKILEGGRK